MVNKFRKLSVSDLVANLCEYFVSIHVQHKNRGIRDASSSSCSRLSLLFDNWGAYTIIFEVKVRGRCIEHRTSQILGKGRLL